MRNRRYEAFRPFRVILVALILGIGAASPVPGRTQSQAPEIEWPEVQLVRVGTFAVSRPTYLTHSADGSGRIFIVEQDGRIQILEGSTLRNTPFLDIGSRVRSPADGPDRNEEGLLGLAFPPQYAQKGYFYVYYTRNSGNNVVSRFHLINPNQADPQSEEPVLVLDHPTYGNHNGGQIAFGPDGYLYIGTGDGGGGGDPFNNAQNRASLLGKILRIDTEFATQADVVLAEENIYLPFMFSPGSGSPPMYLVPPDNPFVSQPAYRAEIWAYGMRNPWRFSFDRQTGELFIGDVGQGSWEEIDYQAADDPGGRNYGWRLMEGSHCYNPANCSTAGLTLPIWEYSESGAACASVTGGYVYRGSDFPALHGIYLFTDYCGGRIQGLGRESGAWQQHDFMISEPWITSFGEDEAGELYAVNRSGAVYQVTVP